MPLQPNQSTPPSSRAQRNPYFEAAGCSASAPLCRRGVCAWHRIASTGSSAHRAMFIPGAAADRRHARARFANESDECVLRVADHGRDAHDSSRAGGARFQIDGHTNGRTYAHTRPITGSRSNDASSSSGAIRLCVPVAIARVTEPSRLRVALPRARWQLPVCGW